MRLSKEDFRAHMDKMLADNNKKQAALWAENGTLIYTNVTELLELYDEEYKDLVE